MKVKLALLAAAALLVAIPAVAQALAPEMTLGGAKLNKRDGTATIPATVNQAGGLTLRTINGRQVRFFHVDTTGAGTYKLAVVPKGATKRRLMKTGEAKITVAVTFGLVKAPDPYTEGEVAQSKVITLKQN